MIAWTRRVLSLLMVCLLPGASGVHAQQIINAMNGITSVEGFGRSVAILGDINGDGSLDYAVGSPDAQVGNMVYCGQVQVFSGATSTVLYSIVGVNAYDQFGRSIDNTGDLNADGTDDFVVGASGTLVNGLPVGRAVLYSGANGAVLRTFMGLSPNDRFGWAVANAGDVNNDGKNDIVVGATQYTPPSPFSMIPSPPGYVVVYSGSNGAILWTIGGNNINDAFGSAVGSAGDVDLDGYDDFIVGARQLVLPFPGATQPVATGYVGVYSGRTGTTIHHKGAAAYGDDFGYTVGGLGDINNDGFGDFFAGAPNRDTVALNNGTVTVFSGQDGSVLQTFEGVAQDDLFGRTAVSVGDINGDGLSELAIGAPLNDTFGFNAGEIRVFSVASGATLMSLHGNGMWELFGQSLGAYSPRRSFIAGGYGGLFLPGLARAYDIGLAILSPCGEGTIDSGTGDYLNLLKVNGSAGGVTRRVDVGLSRPVTISIEQAPFFAFPSRFMIWGQFGAANPGSEFSFSFGTLCFIPSHLSPLNPALFCLTNNFGPDPSQIVSSFPGLWFYTLSSGLPFPVSVVLQGLMETSQGATPLRVTNAVLLDIH